MTMVAQVVQHLIPGGIETMALDLAAFCEENENTIIISLEGDRQSAIRNWPRLQAVANKLIFLPRLPHHSRRWYWTEWVWGRRLRGFAVRRSCSAENVPVSMARISSLERLRFTARTAFRVRFRADASTTG